MKKSLNTYRAKRDFAKTPEPSGRARKTKAGNSYVIQKHAARRLHYDFRLEMDGVLKSWAVPEGPSLVPGVKRLAVHVEDHPIEYGSFEGVIPEGEYGGGTVMVWDKGTWMPEFDPGFGYKKGHLKFKLDGEKLKGMWHLVRMAPKPREKQEAWLLFKSDDEAARSSDDPDILTEQPRSAATGRDIEEIAEDSDRVWSSGQGEITQKPPRKRKPAIKAAELTNAKAGPLPTFIDPTLPTTVERAPSGSGWIHEIKYDGYRIQIRIKDGRATLFTRRGIDWSERFRSVARAAGRLPVKSAVIDGEIAALTEAGVPSFTALTEALGGGATNLVYYAFDLLHLDGFDLKQTPLVERKAALHAILDAADDGLIRFSDHMEGDGALIFRHASRLGLEGIVSKRATAPYRAGRVKTWVKIRTAEQRPFVIAGFIPSSVDKKAIGALVLAEYVDGELLASGHVGTGFNASKARELFHEITPLRTDTAPIEDELAVSKGVKWVDPVLVAEIEYRARSVASGIIRHSAFKSLLEDRTAESVIRPSGEPTAKPPPKKPATVRLTNPSRLLWPDQGVTKEGLADFYTEIADWILPYIVGRPLSLVRCPGGVGQDCFYQKHRWSGLSKVARQVPIPGEDEPMLAIEDLDGLLELVQASVLEIHPWGSKADRPELPDRVTIDLDPGDAVPWEQVVETALEVRERLSAHGLESFVKTTGGKGLHVVFPLIPKADWDTVKAFAQSISEDMAADRPERYTATMAKRLRHGRIYVDYLRNGMGATAVGAYSTRARPGAAVSTPLAWDELGPAIRANHFTIENLPKRLSYLERDPWEGFLSLRQSLPAAAKAKVTKTQSRATSATPTPSAENVQTLLPSAFVPTKQALSAYWRKVGTDALKYLARRPLRLVRHADGKTFYHGGPLPPLPDAVHTLGIEKRSGGEGVRPWIDSVDGLLGLVAIGAVEIHPWGATIDDIERPDMLVFDLDPGEGVAWKSVVAAAVELREVLKGESLDSWPKLTGGKGIDVMVPIEPDLDWDEAHRYAKEIAERCQTAAPGRYTTSARVDRKGRIFIDWLRNGRGVTAIGVYSPRALKGFPVAAPVSWRELERGIKPDAFTIARPPRNS